jgi:hypothetical protein
MMMIRRVVLSILSSLVATAGNNKFGRTYFVAYRVNYVQAITSQERQGAGFVDSVATDPRPPESRWLGSPLFTIAVTLCFREHSYRARRIVYISLHDERSPVSRCRCVSRGETLPWLKFWKAVAFTTVKLTPDAFGFLTLIQVFDGPER